MIKDMVDGDDLKSVCDSDDGIQQQPPPKRRKTKYEGLKLKVVELKKLCKERGLRRYGVKRSLIPRFLEDDDKTSDNTEG